MQAERRFRRRQKAGSRAGATAQETWETLRDLASERPTRGSSHHHISREHRHPTRRPLALAAESPLARARVKWVSGHQEAISPECTQDNCGTKETPCQPAGGGNQTWGWEVMSEWCPSRAWGVPTTMSGHWSRQHESLGCWGGPDGPGRNLWNFNVFKQDKVPSSWRCAYSGHLRSSHMMVNFVNLQGMVQPLRCL